MFKKLLLLSLVIILSTAIFTVSAATESTSISLTKNEVLTNNELSASVSQLENYITISDSGIISFDVQRARDNGESADVIDRGIKLNMFSSEMRKDPTATRTKISLPIWGNWCGPGQSGPASPVDTLDAQCKKHDLCYANRGYFACYCDVQLLENINLNYSKMGVKEKAMAVVISAYFSVSFCNPFA